jgi:serine/threonine protein kinase
MMSSDETTIGGVEGRYGDEPDLSDRRKTSSATIDPEREGSWQADSPAAQGDPRLAAALEEYLDALNSGSPPSREEFLDRHPDIAGALVECLSGLEFIQATGWQLGAEPVLEASRARADQDFPGRVRLGDYRILREVGRGSMGVVYEAEQISLERRVALKVLPFASAIDPRQRQRFLIEAQAAAQLHHPHIVPIYAAGFDQGIHFYAMQYVDGRTLGELLIGFRQEAGDSGKVQPGHRSANADSSAVTGSASLTALPQTVSLTPRSAESDRGVSPRLDPGHSIPVSGSGATGSGPRARSHAREIARLGGQAAEALDHAHGLGVVHRDIKPANLMVDSGGELWITDFGLARFRGDLSLTRSGDLVGTLRYMSPEQALARRGVVDQRTDIYALGLTLYELLTLRPAFDGRDHHELLRQIAMDEPVPPRRLNPAIPRDLETIVMKAICKEPSGRYATAQDLADDLARFRDDRPILARRPTVLERSVRWARRHKQIVVTALTVLVLALAGGAAVVGLQAKKTRQDLQRYILKSFPAIDAITMTAMQQATEFASMGSVGDMKRADMFRVYQKALDFYELAAMLPPTDLASRTIIARAHFRIGFTHAIMSGAYATSDGPDPAHLGQAEKHYRDAISRFELLLAEAPGDINVRSQFADALGEWGLGWFLGMTGRIDQTEPHYRRAIQLRRELVLDSDSNSEVEASIISDELVKLAHLTTILERDLEKHGHTREAKELGDELAATCTTLAVRQTSPDMRRALGRPLGQLGTSLMGDNRHKDGAEMLRLAIRFDPDNPDFLNNLAWLLASTPDSPVHDPARALELAQKVVSLKSENWMYWNSLGVAAYRAGDWKKASEALKKSMSLHQGGDANDWFFLAMARWRQNQPAEARKWLDQALAWTKKNQPRNSELKRFQAEAETLMGLAKEPPASKPLAKD